VVDDARDVLVVPAVRQLVDAHVLEALETIGGAEPGDDAPDDLADSAPRDAEQPRGRRPIHDLREVRGLVLEVAREARTGIGSRHELGANTAACPAVNAPMAVSQRHLHPGEIEVPPSPVAVVVHSARLAEARRAVGHARHRRHIDLNPTFGELEAGHPGLFQSELSSE